MFEHFSGAREKKVTTIYWRQILHCLYIADAGPGVGFWNGKIEKLSNNIFAS